MGLKTTNYKLEGHGDTLPEAYALIKSISITRNTGWADVVIQKSREDAMLKTPYETKRIKFKVNLNENPFVTAYKEALEKKTEEIYNEETGEYEIVEQPAIFDGWEDDVIEENKG